MIIKILVTIAIVAMSAYLGVRFVRSYFESSIERRLRRFDDAVRRKH